MKIVNMLSVIIPVFNVEEYLEQCIESVLLQKNVSFEVILVDDGSTDKSGTICDAFADKDCRVKVIHQKNTGHTTARQKGFLASSGDYILMIDSDDWIDPDMFQTMMKKASDDDADIVQCNFRAVKNGTIDEKASMFEEKLYDKKSLETEIYPKMIYGGSSWFFGIAPNMWNKIFKRELVEKYLFRIDDRIKSGEDGLFTYSCFLAAEKVCILNRCFYNYRSREISMCRITDDKRLNQNHILFEYYQKWFYNNIVLKKQIELYVIWQTLQAVEGLIRNGNIRRFKKRYPYFMKDSLEGISVRNTKLSEVRGKKNKLMLMGLKFWK